MLLVLIILVKHGERYTVMNDRTYPNVAVSTSVCHRFSAHGKDPIPNLEAEIRHPQSAGIV